MKNKIHCEIARLILSFECEECGTTIEFDYDYNPICPVCGKIYQILEHCLIVDVDVYEA